MKYSTVILFLSFLCLSCNDHQVDISTYTASINLVNAIASYDANIKTNFTGGKIIYTDGKDLGYFNTNGTYTNGVLTYGLPAGKNIPLIIVLAADTTKPIFNQSYTFARGDIYSMYVTGKPDAPSVLLLKDSIPTQTSENTGIRCINLSPNIDAISINIAGDTPVSLADHLSYKSITQFQTFPVGAADQYYILEVHNTSTGELLTTFFYYNLIRGGNTTFIVRGLVNDSPGIEIVRFDN